MLIKNNLSEWGLKIQVIKYDEVLNFKMRRAIGHLREQMLAKGLFLDYDIKRVPI